MRRTMLSAVPVLAALIAAPAGAQVSARIHLDIPIGRQAPRYYAGPIRPVVIYDYSPSYFGDWEDDYWDWMPVTLYFYDGRYYEQPYLDARPVLMYRYRDRFFAAPRDSRFQIWERQYGRSSGRVFQNSRDFRDFRDRNGRFDSRNDNRGGQFDPRNDNRGRQVTPRDDGRNRGGQFDPRAGGGRVQGGGQVDPRAGGVRGQGGGQFDPRSGGGRVQGGQGGQGGQVAPRGGGRGQSGQAPPSSGRDGRQAPRSGRSRP